MITGFTILTIKILCGKKMPVSILANFFKLNCMFHIPFFLFKTICLRHLPCQQIKKLMNLIKVIFGTLCAYLLFPNIIKNSILNLTVNNS
ncbi:MAG: hypothetical protein CBC01_05550 [Betaproteobacteria bacterium TMED41]|nr:MAG: hypothetical protein CBC01_05550 [Betaproteobacteria bacterium TMED41]